MCGIAGTAIAPFSSIEIAPADRTDAIAALRHRGPDDHGEFQDENVWLAHTRLSILDPSMAGHQPMSSADGRYVISYNGEVYNFRQLAARYQLENLRSASDTEVVLNLFARLGLQSLPYLNGMFAFACYDRDAQKLWLVRDRFGIKPLYFQFDSDSLTFASEIKSILTLRTGPRTCNWSALHEWLYYGNALGGDTLYQGIHQLLPGRYLELDLKSFEYEVGSYWSLKDDVPPRPVREKREDAIAETRRLLEQAVARQLVSDVPVGVFLSGGIDSSAIAAFASRHYDGQLATYSAGFDFAADGGELPKARTVAERFKTDHHEIQVGSADLPGVIEKMVEHHDMPFADAANIPLYLMATHLDGQLKVILQGDGGDEIFGGYRRYSTLKYYTLLRPLALVFKHFHKALPKSVMQQRIARYLHAFAASDLATTMALLLTPEDVRSRPLGVFSAEVARRMTDAGDPFSRYRSVQSEFCDLDTVNQMSMVDTSVILPDIYLEKVDRSTMAASLEVRVPFLDNDLTSYVLSLSGRSKMPNGRPKWLLKEALRGIVPDEILFSPKRGFQVPYGFWLQSSLKALFFDNLATFVSNNPGILDPERISSLFATTESGRQNYSPLLWKMLNFLVWANTSKVDFAEAR